jgi:phosphate transport system substrate-binding protein
MRKSVLFAVVLSLAGAALAGLCHAEDKIRINGSGSALDMMKPLVEAYAKKYPAVRIEMERPLGSSGAVKALLAGALDIAVSSKRLKPEEAAQGARQTEYGKTPLVIVTEKNVPLTNITTQELEDIFTGKVTTWKNGELIRLVLRPEGDIDTTILRGLSSGMNSAVDASKSRFGMVIAVTDPEAYGLIVKTPGGIGASGLTSIIVERLSLKILALNGVKPSPKTLANGSYPLAKGISFVTTSRTPPAALKFIGFVHSPQGRAIAEKAGVLVTAGPAPGK